jgi:hypothetical protein
MIDWYLASFGALWIFGLSLEFAVLSFAYYQAGQQKQSFVSALEMPTCRSMINLGLTFFCLGWTGSAAGTWERIVWAILTLIFAVRTWQVRKISNT